MSCFSRARPNMDRLMSSSHQLSPPSPSLDIFIFPDADTLIVSSDAARFRVHKSILAHTSSIFEGMFTVPTPTPSANATESEDDLPVIPLTEPGHIVEQLLCFAYPSLNGSVQDLKTLRQLFAAAEKYDMKGVIAQLGFILRHQFVEKEPQCAYALACIYGLPEEAKLAAKSTLLQTHPGPLLPEYDEMPATMYYRLTVYRQKCMDAIQPLINDWGYRIYGLKDIAWTRCAFCPRPYSNTVDGPSYWFADHLERTRAAYLARPRGSTVASTKLVQETLNKHFPPITPSTPRQRHEPRTEAGGECVCRMQAPMRLMDFNERLAAILEKKISEIAFPLT